MVNLFGVEVVEAPRTKATKGSPLERQEWAYTFAYVHQTGPLAAAVLVRCAHVAGITYDDDGAVKYMHEFFESRALTAAMLQHQRVAITKAVKLLVGLGALIPNGRHRYTNGKATECYQLGGMFTEWQVLSPAQADAVDVVRQAEEVAEEVSVNKTSDVASGNACDVASGNTNRETITWVEPAKPVPINSELLEMAAGPTDSLEILNKCQHGFNPSLCCLTQRQIEERTCTDCGQPLPAVDPANSAMDPEIANLCILCVTALVAAERKARNEGFDQRQDAARHHRTIMTSAGLREIGE